MPTISVAMATYNGARHLPVQLESLANQTVAPVELIIRDDGSTDDTAGVVEAFARKAPFPVRFVRNTERLGYKANFIRCAELCQGDLIAFCDQDDIWDPERLGVVAGELVASDSLLVFHKFRLIDQDGRALGAAEGGRAGRNFGPWDNVYGITELFDRRLLAFSPLWAHSVDHFKADEPMAHDQWVYFLAHAFGRVKYLDTELLSYRQHQANVCGFVDEKSAGTMSAIGSNVGRLVSGLLDQGEAVSRKRDHLNGYFAGLAAGAESRARICEEIAAMQTGLALRPGVQQDYQQRHQYYTRRSALYGRSSRAGRASHYRALYSDGAYTRNGPRGVKDGILDLVYGLLA